MEKLFHEGLTVLNKIQLRFFKTISVFIKNITNHMSYVYKQYVSSKSIWYRIDEIDIVSQKITLALRGKNIAVKINIKNAICDKNIIRGLSSTHACWVGYYYGSWYKNNRGKDNIKCKEHPRFSFLLESHNETYKILYQKRGGLLCYMNAYTLEMHESQPIDLAKNPAVISKFGPSQACYIGILSGLQSVTENIIYLNKNDKKKANLYLVS
jgi:hypothetical protein